MSDGKAIPVWFTDDDHRRVKEAAALAGYKHLSKYIRDKVLGRREANETLDAQAEREALGHRLADIEHAQRTSEVLLAMLTALVARKATTGEINDLRVAASAAVDANGLLANAAPELAALAESLVSSAR
ncbi:hypothetical protein OR16_04387 [Cupriavidus basilensis OR16]|uniref:Conjugal transfer protein TraA n=1 Tax=Cupriavidus basilensis OR16 TaxID=1127483 RepID=H1RZW9_9BURK|nr:hypothetical protein [Cupriavidus basilensis]EHP44185.1 hypothetical protein OR16_04387 [Cupriavidus basilensis OR16]